MFENVKDDLIKYGQLAGKMGYTPGISGNMSARYGDKIVITSSGSANGFLKHEDLVVIDFDAKVLDGEKKPSSEKFLHIEFYKKRFDVNYILHFHSPYLTSFAATGLSLDEPILPEIVYCFGKIPLAEYAIPGSEELVNYTSKYFTDYDIILMKNHGVIVGGKSIEETYLKLDLAEAYAKTIICTKILGGAKILPTKEVEKIYLLRQN